MKFDIGGIKYKLSNDSKKCHILTDCFINRRKYEQCCLVQDNQYSTSDNYTLRTTLPPNFYQKPKQDQSIQDSPSIRTSQVSQQQDSPSRHTSQVSQQQDSPSRHTSQVSQSHIYEGELIEDMNKLDIKEHNKLVTTIYYNIDVLIKNNENKYNFLTDDKIRKLKNIKNYFIDDILIKTEGGGKNTKRSQYKKMLEKKDVKKLYKMAKEMGIKITKKKDGKTSYIKKETIVKKICDAKYKICNKKK
jgi:hypothetical protein